jgi:hypothetical protein
MGVLAMSQQMSEEEVYDLAKKRVREKKDFYNHVVIYVVINILLIIIWAFTSQGYPWFIWPLAGWGVGLIFHGLGVFVFNKQSSWEKSEIEKEAEKIRKGK